MTNQRIAELLAGTLRTGLTHPGNGADQQPVAIPLPLFRTAGMPKELADLQNATAKLMSEAIVHFIETEGASVIVGKAELEKLRSDAAVAEGIEPQTLSVHCRRCDRDHANPLLLAKLRNAPFVEVDGKQVIKGLSEREIACPHEVKK